MDSQQATSIPWSRQDILSLLQLMAVTLIPLFSCIWRLIIARSKCDPFKLSCRLAQCHSDVSSEELQYLFCVLNRAQGIVIASLLG